MQLQDLTEHYDTAHIAKGFLLPASEQINSTESVVFVLFQQTLKRKNGLKITYKKSDIQTYFNVAYLINVIGFEHVRKCTEMGYDGTSNKKMHLTDSQTRTNWPQVNFLFVMSYVKNETLKL